MVHWIFSGIIGVYAYIARHISQGCFLLPIPLDYAIIQGFAGTRALHVHFNVHILSKIFSTSKQEDMALRLSVPPISRQYIMCD